MCNIFLAKFITKNLKVIGVSKSCQKATLLNFNLGLCTGSFSNNICLLLCFIQLLLHLLQIDDKHLSQTTFLVHTLVNWLLEHRDIFNGK